MSVESSIVSFCLLISELLVAFVQSFLVKKLEHAVFQDYEHFHVNVWHGLFAIGFYLARGRVTLVSKYLKLICMLFVKRCLLPTCVIGIDSPQAE